MPKITSRSEALSPDSANRVLHVNRLVSAASTPAERAYLDPAAASSNPKHCGSARQPAAHEMCNRPPRRANAGRSGTPGNSEFAEYTLAVDLSLSSWLYTASRLFCRSGTVAAEATIDRG